MTRFQTVFLDFDGVMVHAVPFFRRFLRGDTDNIALGDHWEYDPSLGAFFQFCQENSIKVIMTSLSSQSSIGYFLEHINIDGWYTSEIPLIGYHETNYEKYDSHFWHSCIDTVKADQDTILVIDDSIDCLMAAKKSGLCTCHYRRFANKKSTQNQKVDYHVKSFSDIIKILSGNASCNGSFSV